MTVIAPLDNRLSILNPVNHFSTHLETDKRKFDYYTFALIISFHVHHHYLQVHAPSPSSLVLLCLTQITLHNGISYLVSLITKTKLGLSAVEQRAMFRAMRNWTEGGDANRCWLEPGQEKMATLHVLLEAGYGVQNGSAESGGFGLFTGNQTAEG
jgi:hypothetical protein